MLGDGVVHVTHNHVRNNVYSLGGYAESFYQQLLYLRGMDDSFTRAETGTIIDPLRSFARRRVADVNNGIMHREDKRKTAEEGQRQQVEPQMTELHVNDIWIEGP